LISLHLLQDLRPAALVFYLEFLKFLGCLSRGCGGPRPFDLLRSRRFGGLLPSGRSSVGLLQPSCDKISAVNRIIASCR
jgi:hypothetical protein